MATDKKSFVLYCDSIAIVEKLSDERAGKLIKHIFRYCSDLEPICDDEVVDMAFEHFKSILKRDLIKYKKIVDRNKANGLKGGRPSKDETEVIPENPVGYFETQENPTEPKKADTDTDTDNVNDSVIDISFKKETKKNIFNFRKELIRYGFQENLVDDWITVRKAKKASNTETAFKAFISEIEQRTCNINEMLFIAVTNSWSGFKHEWLDNLNNNKNGKQQITSTDEFKQIVTAVKSTGVRR